MGRRKLPEHKKKRQVSVAVDDQILAMARESGNASEWINDMLKFAIERKKFANKKKEKQENLTVNENTNEA